MNDYPSPAPWWAGDRAVPASEHETTRWRRLRRRRPVWVVGIGLVVAVAIATWAVTASVEDDARSPEQVVDAFFRAQRRGDCEELLVLLTEESWSDGGRRPRDEFLDQCADAVEGYRPNVQGVRVTETDGDSATVIIVEQGGNPEGHLVRRDGRWQVETDPYVLHVGRSIEETVTGYTDAYVEGDCERMLDHLAEPLWSNDGARDEQGFLESCGQAAAVRSSGPTRLQLRVSSLSDVSVDDEGAQASASIDVAADGVADILGVNDTVVSLVRDGLEWTIAETQTRGRRATAAPFVALDIAAAQQRLLDVLAVPDGRCVPGNGVDTTEVAIRVDDGPPGVTRNFHGDCSASVTLYVLESPSAAEGFVEEVATAALHDTTTTVDVPNQQAAVPGMPDAHRVRAHCLEGGCYMTIVVAAQGDMVVEVHLPAYYASWPDSTDPPPVDEDADLTEATAILRAQMEAL